VGASPHIPGIRVEVLDSRVPQCGRRSYSPWTFLVDFSIAMLHKRAIR
jgi:hypothetical protein